VRRELSDNFCWYSPKYDSLEGQKYDWAKDTLQGTASRSTQRSPPAILHSTRTDEMSHPRFLIQTSPYDGASISMVRARVALVPKP
jgi:hypothetical protein